ncbi:MAG: hypothetical protein O7I93_18875 [Gemmatimonadetes bacterium]|nr:hypothetical protein [Gemmatimonadota bacterium]
MKHAENYRDFLVGLFVLGSLGIILGLVAVTSDIFDEPQEIYMRTTTAAGLTADTKVVLQGLQVGRLDEINPLVDANGLVFIAHLHLRQTYPDGTPLRILKGTRAVIAEPSLISAAEVRLELPIRKAGTDPVYLSPGDTIESEWLPGAAALLGGVATELKEQVVQTLEQAHSLMERGTSAIARAEGMLQSTEAMVGRTSPQVDSALQLLVTTLKRTDTILSEVSPRIGPLQDSLMLMLAEARSILRNFDTLAVSTQVFLEENRETVRLALEQLSHATRTLDHFAQEVSRRPTRLLTGVEPPPPDTSEARR